MSIFPFSPEAEQERLGIKKESINHLKRQPHIEALKFAWDKWNSKNRKIDLSK